MNKNLWCVRNQDPFNTNTSIKKGDPMSEEVSSLISRHVLKDTLVTPELVLSNVLRGYIIQEENHDTAVSIILDNIRFLGWDLVRLESVKKEPRTLDQNVIDLIDSSITPEKSEENPSAFIIGQAYLNRYGEFYVGTEIISRGFHGSLFLAPNLGVVRFATNINVTGDIRGDNGTHLLLTPGVSINAGGDIIVEALTTSGGEVSARSIRVGFGPPYYCQ